MSMTTSCNGSLPGNNLRGSRRLSTGLLRAHSRQSVIGVYRSFGLCSHSYSTVILVCLVLSPRRSVKHSNMQNESDIAEAFVIMNELLFNCTINRGKDRQNPFLSLPYVDPGKPTVDEACRK